MYMPHATSSWLALCIDPSSSWLDIWLDKVSANPINKVMIIFYPQSLAMLFQTKHSVLVEPNF